MHTNQSDLDKTPLTDIEAKWCPECGALENRDGYVVSIKFAQDLERKLNHALHRMKLLDKLFEFAFLEKDAMYELHGYDQKYHCIWCGGLKSDHHEKCEVYNTFLELVKTNQLTTAANLKGDGE